MTATLPVSELFGPTIQGEGPAAGQAAMFLRTMGCNLSCSWCDTPYTWDGHRFDLRAETTHMTPHEIAEKVAGRAPIVVITGGEPLLHQEKPGWLALLGLLVRKHRIHIETNGTKLPNWPTLRHAEVINVSPKLPNAGRHRGRQNPAIHPELGEHAQRYHNLHLKVVCTDAEDVERAALLATEHGWPTGRVWVMPEGTTRDTLAQRWPVIADAAIKHGLNATHRLHVMAWGDERGH